MPGRRLTFSGFPVPDPGHTPLLVLDPVPSERCFTVRLHQRQSQWLAGFHPNYSRIKEDGSDQHRHPLFFASELFMPLFKTFYCSLQNSLRMKGVNKKGSQRWTLTMRPGGFANSGYSQRWGPRIVLKCGCKHTLPKPHPLRLPQRHMSQIPSPLFSTPLQLADRLCSCNFKATP